MTVPGTEGVTEVTTLEELRAIVGEPSGRAVTKERAALTEMDRRWLAASPLCLVATSDATGDCDVSPKGDPPGFARVLDDRTIAIPDRPGNKRVDGFVNLLANPRIGLLFMIPGRGDTLRINGSARIVSDAPFFDDMVVKGHRPKLAVVVDIEQVFFHCAKAFLRSQLWKSETWRPDALPPHAHIVKAVQDTPETVDELLTYYGPSYEAGMYR